MNKLEIIKSVEKGHLRKKRIATFSPGDVLKVHLKIKEGDKERIQIFEGMVIGRKGDGVRETFKVRRIASGVGVERTFNLHSPLIEDLQVVKRGDVSRAKLYYLRGKTGRHAKVKQMQREKLLQLQADEMKAIEAEQAASAVQAAAEAAVLEAQEKEAKAKAEKQAEA
jgi:large subunit ribosomal protein L19